MKKFSKKLRIFLGLRYAVNTKTREVHDLKNLHKNCHEETWNLNDFWFARWKDIDWKINNGCRWCMKKQDRG